jgi:hypothetical protein
MSSGDDQDVIEIGADGAFDISTPPKKVETKQFKNSSSQIPSTSKKVSSSQIPSEEILNLVPVGEYKVFTSPGSKESFLIIHLHEIEEPKQVRLVNHELLIEFGSHSLSVDIKDLNVDESSIHTTLWRDFITFRFFKLTQ